MFRFGWLCCLLCLAGACSTPRTSVAVPGSGAIIFAEPELAQRISEAIQRYEPRVIDVLGTRWTEPYEVVASDEELPYDLLAGTHLDNRRVELGPRARNLNLVAALVHELAHVHQCGPWARLPVVVQEGVAIRVRSIAMGDRSKPTKVPDPEALRLALSISHEEFVELEGKWPLLLAANWISYYLLPQFSESTVVPNSN